MSLASICKVFRMSSSSHDKHVRVFSGVLCFLCWVFYGFGPAQEITRNFYFVLKSVIMFGLESFKSLVQFRNFLQVNIFLAFLRMLMLRMMKLKGWLVWDRVSVFLLPKINISLLDTDIQTERCFLQLKIQPWIFNQPQHLVTDHSWCIFQENRKPWLSSHDTTNEMRSFDFNDWLYSFDFNESRYSL